MNARRILLVTDIPFWHHLDGAQSRIYSLNRFLSSHDRNCTVFVPVDLDEKSIQLAAQKIFIGLGYRTNQRIESHCFAA